jgi:Acyltransferase
MVVAGSHPNYRTRIGRAHESAAIELRPVQHDIRAPTPARRGGLSQRESGRSGNNCTVSAYQETSSRVPTPSEPTLVRRGARGLLSLFGWRVEITWPPVPKCIIVFYPHTSNWDFVVGYLGKIAAGLPAHWIAKDTLFHWPFGGLLRRMGGIPVNRREPTGLIRHLAVEIQRRPWMWLAVAPEGTRSYTDHWKSGFYRLALAANVPVGLAFIDYRNGVLGLTTYLSLTGREDADLDRIRAAYAGKVGKHPDQAGPIRFSVENAR